jgi:hypothetical protein
LRTAWLAFRVDARMVRNRDDGLVKAPRQFDAIVECFGKA